VVFATWYAFYIHPRQVEVETLQSHIQDLIRQVQATRVESQRLEQLKKEVAQLEAQVAELEKRVYDRSRVPEILRQVVSLGEAHQLRFAAVYPYFDRLLEDHTTEGSPLKILPVELRLSGEFLRIGLFIEKIQELPFLFSLEEIEMTLTRESYPWLETTITGKLYLRQETTAEPGKVKAGSGNVESLFKRFVQ